MRGENRGEMRNVSGLLRNSYTAEEHDSVSHSIDHDYTPREPAEPTKARPGSWQKIEVMEARLANFQPLFVEGDETIQSKATTSAEWTRGYLGHRKDAHVMNKNIAS